MARITKDPDTRRKEFIKAARDLFLEKGFDQTTVNDITNYVSMSHGSFFYYFKSKNEVMKEVIKYNLNYWKKLMTDLVANKELTALEKMETILKMTIESQSAKVNINEFYAKEGNAIMYREQRKRSREIIIPLITQIVEQGVKEGTINIEYPKETVEYVSYILENLGDSLKETKNKDEYLRKIRALEILLTKIAGIGELNIQPNTINYVNGEEK